MGNALTLAKQGLFPVKTTFTVDQIPDLTGRVIIVTGGNTGLGKETIRALLKRNAKVYMASRSRGKAEEAIKELHEDTGNKPIFLELDLASLASVRQAAQEFLNKEPALHILFNNAGLMTPPMDQLTVEGYDLQFGTNVLGHFLFTELLIPALTAGARSSPDNHSRVITTSSAGAHMFTVDFDALRDSPIRTKLGPQNLYYQSKFLNVVVALEIARRYADQGILSMSCDPGSLQTDLLRYQSPLVRRITGWFFSTPAQGSVTQLWAGTMPDAIHHNGEYIVPWAHPSKCRREAYDRALGERVWNYLLEQVKAH